MSRLEGAAPVFSALGDPTRLALLAKLADGAPRSLASLSSGAGVTRQAVTKHLRVLEGAGLVGSARAGRETHYALQAERIAAARDWLDDISRQWDDALGRLVAHLEAD